MFARILKAIIAKDNNIVRMIQEPTFGLYYVPEINKAVFLESQWSTYGTKIFDVPTKAAQIQLRQLIKKTRK